MTEASEIIQIPHVNYVGFTYKEPGVQVIRLFDTHYEVQGKAIAEKKDDDAILKEVNHDYIYTIHKSKISQIECGYHNIREIYEVSIYCYDFSNCASNFPCIDRKSAFDLYKKLKNWFLT